MHIKKSYCSNAILYSTHVEEKQTTNCIARDDKFCKAWCTTYHKAHIRCNRVAMLSCTANMLRTKSTIQYSEHNRQQQVCEQHIINENFKGAEDFSHC